MSDFQPEDQLSEIKLQLEAQKKRYEKLKFKHSHSGEALYELRQSFQGSLNKLNSLDTRDVAVRELRQLIDRNITNDALKIYLTSLGEVKKIKSPGAREQEVLIIGFIAQVFGERVLEDGQKSLIKIIEIIKEFYGDLSRSVHEAAASAFCEVYIHCARKEKIEETLGIFFDPLEIGMTSGVNVKAQQAASLSIFKWLQVLVQEENTEVLQAISPRVVSLYVKLRTDFPDLISALGVIMEYHGVNQVIQEIHPIIKKTLQYLSVSGTGTHLCKIEACKLLSCLAKHLQGIADIVIEPYHNEVIYILQQVKIDKLQAVQNAARTALQDWKTLEHLQKEIEDQKMQEISMNEDEVLKFSGLQDISPGRMGPNNFKAIRELAKRNKKNGDWGLSKPKFLEKKTGNYSISPSQSREFGKKLKEESYYPNVLMPKEGLNKHVMEVINKKSLESKARSEIVPERETPEPRREVFVKHIGQRENLNSLSSKIQETFKSMENVMDCGFATIEKRLENLDNRMDSAYDRLQGLNSKPSVPSFIHPPKLDLNTAFTQTQNNVEIQAAMSQNSLNSGRMDSLSLAWVEVLQCVNSGNIDEAYKKVLATGDDIYLLRLMHKTGVCLKGLTSEVGRNVINRLAMILNSNFLENLGMAWIEEAVRERVFARLRPEDKEDVLQVLERYRNLPGEEGEYAEAILNSINY